MVDSCWSVNVRRQKACQSKLVKIPSRPPRHYECLPRNQPLDASCSTLSCFQALPDSHNAGEVEKSWTAIIKLLGRINAFWGCRLLHRF